MQSDLLSIFILLILISILPHAFSISVISSLTWCTKSGWSQAGRQPISGPQQYAGNWEEQTSMQQAQQYAEKYAKRNGKSGKVCTMHNMPRSMQVEHERAEKYAEQMRVGWIEAKQVDNEKIICEINVMWCSLILDGWRRRQRFVDKLLH